MAISTQYFPGQNPSERVFLVLRRSVFTYAAFLSIALIMLIPFILVFVFYVRNIDLADNSVANGLITLGGSAYLLFIIGLLLYGFVDYYLDVYIITDERIVDIKQIGFFRREIAELHLQQIQDVSARVKGFFPTLFHFGDIFIQTAGERENFIFYAVPHPYRVSKKIADLHQAQIEKQRLESDFIIERGLDRIGNELHPTAGAVSASNLAMARPESDLIGEHINDLTDRGSVADPFEVHSRADLTSALPKNRPMPDEYYSDRGLDEDAEKGEESMDAGLKRIDDYVKEVDDEYQTQIVKTELKEGEVKKIGDG